jgi:hypothetical protein
MNIGIGMFCVSGLLALVVFGRWAFKERKQFYQDYLKRKK